MCHQSGKSLPKEVGFKLILERETELMFLMSERIDLHFHIWTHL